MFCENIIPTLSMFACCASRELNLVKFENEAPPVTRGLTITASQPRLDIPDHPTQHRKMFIQAGRRVPIILMQNHFALCV